MLGEKSLLDIYSRRNAGRLRCTCIDCSHKAKVKHAVYSDLQLDRVCPFGNSTDIFEGNGTALPLAGGGGMCDFLSVA